METSNGCEFANTGGNGWGSSVHSNDGEGSAERVVFCRLMLTFVTVTA
jgi:hypothetical protein